MNQMNPMKLKYKNEILLFFILVFGFIILYYGLGKICNKRPIIEGITSSDNNKSATKASDKDTKNTTSKGDSLEVKEMKQRLKIMDNDITNKIQPKVNKILEKIQNVSKEIYGGIKKKTDEKLNSFAEKNNESTAVSSQKKVPPFSASEINNSI
jgi:hypothetical protein